MDTYTLLRHVADSWVLLAMFCFFLGAGVWAFLPSQKTAREDASMIPFRHEDRGIAPVDEDTDGQGGQMKGKINV